MPTKEQVQAKRYKNSDKVPGVGDLLEGEDGSTYVVASVGGCPDMFRNCTFDGKFVLTHPEDFNYLGSRSW